MKTRRLVSRRATAAAAAAATSAELTGILHHEVNGEIDGRRQAAQRMAAQLLTIGREYNNRFIFIFVTQRSLYLRPNRYYRLRKVVHSK